jgi:SAM-dependent methyltransferase
LPGPKSAERVTVRVARACWCGGELGEEIGRYYRGCNACGAAVLAVLPAPEHFDVSDDERDFYGKRYWTDYSRARDLPDIGERVRSDLSERCVFWLERLLEVVQPPGRALEIGCAHGAFVRLMQDLGFDAVGTELSGWVVDFAKRTFDVPVLRGRLETLNLEPGFKCIAAFDVLEHLNDPLETVRRCADLLAPDGVLLLQTPYYRGEGPDWSMFQEDEHIHLLTEASIRLLLARAGFRDVLVQPSLFPYDMWVVATPGQLHMRTGDEVETAGGWRLPAAFRSLLDLTRQLKGAREDLAVADTDRVARLAQVEELTRLLRESDADRSARLAQMEERDRCLRALEATRVDDTNKLTALLRDSEAAAAARLAQIRELGRELQESEADRATRLEQICELGRQLQESEADRAARLERIRVLGRQLQKSEADGAARLEQIRELGRQLQESEADRVARVEDVRTLTARLRDSEADRAARLEQIGELGRQLQESEADRAARLEQIRELGRQLQESEADRAARFEVIQNLQARIDEIEIHIENSG